MLADICPALVLPDRGSAKKRDVHQICLVGFIVKPIRPLWWINLVLNQVCCCSWLPFPLLWGGMLTIRKIGAVQL